MFDLGILAQPVAANPPCGSDLDLEGDVQYLNYIAGVESKFPKSYFEVKDANGELKRFDAKSIDAEQFFETAKPLFLRTRDLRLLILLAKISILARDLASFVKLVEAVALLLDTEWDNIHPKGEDGDFAYRGVTIESLDALPTVINPLQFLPLIENRRHGTISYRVIQIVSGEIGAGENEVVPDQTTVERIIEEADLKILRTTSANFVQLAMAIDRIRVIWSERSGSGLSLSVDRLSKTTTAIVAWLRQAIVRRDPDAVPVEADVDAASVDAESAPGMAPAVAGKVPSTAAAAAALVAIATYFASAEPSNPALLLVRQAQQMIGKSFVEVIQILVPLHAAAAAIHVGKQQTFDLPISPMAPLLNTGESFVAHSGDSQDIVFSVENRTQALALMENVAAYFRRAEPSNPIPFLIDKAKEMAQRDFLALLRDVLPEGALKTLDT